MKIIRIMVGCALGLFGAMYVFGQAKESTCKNETLTFQSGDVDFFDVPGIGERNRIFMEPPIVNAEQKYKSSYMRLYMRETSEAVVNRYKKESSPCGKILRLGVTSAGKLQVFHNGNLLAERDIPRGKFFFVTIDESKKYSVPAPFWGDIPLIGSLFQNRVEDRQLITKWIKLN